LSAFLAVGLPQSNAQVKKIAFVFRDKRQPGRTPDNLRGTVTDIRATLGHPDRAAAKRAFEAMMQMGKIDVAKIEAALKG